MAQDGTRWHAFKGMGAAGYCLGIDLGTTFTAAAIHRDGTTDIAPLGNRTAAIPSLVFLRDDASMLVGEAAERRGVTEPDRLAREFKRRVGDSVPIMLGQTPYSAERLLAFLLKQVVASVSEREGGPPQGTTVCHPANWGPFKIDLFRHAVDLAGISNVTLLTEPVAAAIHYASTERVEPGTSLAVYDLGGGTFDAAVLQKSSIGFSPRGEPEGIERLGGIDFDDAVLAHVRRALGEQFEAVDGNDPAARSALVRLRHECMDAKEALSFDTDTTVSVVLPGIQTELRITRAEFEPMIRPAISETIDALRRALERASVSPDELAAVLLVGGSSRIPLVAELVADAVGRPVAVDAHPKHTVALGAALAAASSFSDTGAAEAMDSGSAVVGAWVKSVPGSTGSTGSADAAFSGASTGSAGSAGSPGSAGSVPDAPTSAMMALDQLRPDQRSSRHQLRRGRMLVGVVALLAAAVVAGAYVWNPGADSAGACAGETGRCAVISNIDIADGRYIAEYETEGFDPLIFIDGEQGTPDAHHVHFFFDTTAPSNAGTNGDPPGEWIVWDRPQGGGELRFDGLTVDARGDASRLCVAVADRDHAVDAGSATCTDLPEV